MYNYILYTLVLSVGFNILMFFPAFFLKTDKLTDISYALTFIFLAVLGMLQPNSSYPHLILTTMIILWAVRLGGYLLTRIRKIGKDNRFDNMRKNFVKFAGFWLLQGFTVWAVLIPSNIFYGNYILNLNNLSYLGILIWVIGLLIETFADLQKYRFINDSKNMGKWISTGLWKYSRHPNYFGEIMLWVGVYLFVLPGLTLNQAILGLFGPLYIATLIIFVSGIPLLEKNADERWGDNPKYQEYKKITSSLMMLPQRKI